MRKQAENTKLNLTHWFGFSHRDVQTKYQTEKYSANNRQYFKAMKTAGLYEQYHANRLQSMSTQGCLLFLLHNLLVFCVLLSTFFYS